MRTTRLIGLLLRVIALHAVLAPPVLAQQAQEPFGNYINGLPPVGTLAGPDQFYPRQGGISKQINAGTLASSLGLAISNPTTLNVSNFPGATAGDQIAACVAALPSSGGTCDARGLSPGGTIPTITLSKSGTTILGPCGQFNVTGSINIYNPPAGQMSGFQWHGCGASFTPGAGTQFAWAGNSTDPLLDLRGVRESQFTNFSIASTPAQPLAEGIRLETVFGGISTNRGFRNILVYATNTGGLGKGFRWCTGTACGNAGGDANNDLDYLENVLVENYDTCAYSIEGTQSKTHTFMNSSFEGLPPTSQSGVCTTAGSFRWFGGAGGANAVADFSLGQVTDYILIQGCNTESSSRLLNQAGVGSWTWSVSVIGCRFAANNLNADGNFIVYGSSGPLNLIGLEVEAYSNSPTILMNPSGPTTGNAIGNVIQSASAAVGYTPFLCTNATFGAAPCWNLMGNLLKDLTQVNNYVVADTRRSNPLLVSQLPVCNAQSQGNSQFVTDQNTAPSYRGAVTGGGMPGISQWVTCGTSSPGVYAYYQGK
jgi:hypothetical protein